jgi:hypothetical protein
MDVAKRMVLFLRRSGHQTQFTQELGLTPGDYRQRFA